MKKYAFTYSVHQTFSGPITKHNFLLRCMPGTYPFQRSYAQKLTVTPFTALNCTTDVFGNGMYTGTIDKKHAEFNVTATGFVLCSKYLIHEPLDRLYSTPRSSPAPRRRCGAFWIRPPCRRIPGTGRCSSAIWCTAP